MKCATSSLSTALATFASISCSSTGRGLCIECDGHDFHERTKEQAQRDREKDREIQRRGFSILRFTGSEIYQNPASCAEQILFFVSDLYTPKTAATGET